MRSRSALIILVSFVALAMTPLNSAAQQQNFKYKDPGTSSLFAVLITGGGHFYSGESGKGLALLGGSIGSLVLGISLSEEASLTCWNYNCTVEENLTPLYLGAAVAAGLWIYGIADAGNAARRSNERNGIANLKMGVKPNLSDPLGSRPALSLSYRF